MQSNNQIAYERVQKIINDEIEFLAEYGVEHQKPVRSAEERIRCLENIKHKILQERER